MTIPRRAPSYEGRGLLNLIAELESRLTGTSPSPRLDPDLAAHIPAADSYVVVLFDGLGDHQLTHPAADPLSTARRAVLDAPFPTTTTVGLATLATGLAPTSHGLVAYHLWLPEASAVVNTLKWTTPWGDPLAVDTARFLPAPNLWERLRAAGAEPVTVQPGHFEGSPLSEVLYRGCRFEPIWSEQELAEAAAQLAAVPGRLIVAYAPHVDVAAHVVGQQSEDYTLALGLAASIWERIAARLPAGAVAVGTADHGHVDYGPQDKVAVPECDGVTFHGDPRALFVRGEGDGAALAADLPARWYPLEQMAPWWGPGPAHPQLAARAPLGVLLADDGHVLLPRHMDRRLIGYHGGLDRREVEIPLLVAGPGT